MPFVTRTPVIAGSVPAVFPAGSEVVVQRAQINATASDVAVNSVGAFLILPAGCVPVSIHLDSDADFASVSIGIVNDAETAISTLAEDGGGNWFDATNNAFVQLLYTRRMARVRAVPYDRKVGIRLGAAGTVGVIGMTMAYRAA